MNRRTTSRAVAAAARSAVALESLELRRLLSYDLAATYTDTANGDDYENFGRSLAINGSLALIGSPGQTASLGSEEPFEQIDTTEGQVSLVDTTNGTILQTFQNPLGDANGSFFGAAVAWVDGKIAISAPNSVAVYIYDNWLDSNPDRTYNYGNNPFVGFGGQLVEHGGDLLVSVQQDPATGLNNNGSILRFDLDSGSALPAQTIFNPAGAGITNDQFASHLASDGTNIYAWYKTLGTVPGTSTGHVVVMNSTGSALHTYDGLDGNVRFGEDLTPAGGNSVVFSDVSSGTVEHVGPTGAIQSFVIPVETPGFPIDDCSLAVSDGKLILGNPTALKFGENSEVVMFGAAYVFDLASGALEETIPHALPGEGFPELADTPDEFGLLVGGLPGGKILVTAPGANNENGINAGTIYVYAPQSTEPENEAPTDVAIAGDSSAVRQQAISFTGSFTDANTADTHTVSWDFGDGNVIAAHPTTDAGALAVSHAYETAGEFTVTMTITDSASASTTATFAVTITATAVEGGTLSIGGSAGVDNVVLVKDNTGATVVTIDGVTSTFTGDRIVIFGGAGNDVIDASKTINATLEAYGGAGNDVIAGGGIGDILAGGDGDDNLVGGKGRDLIIGGDGADTIVGDQDNDILIAGYTIHDGDSAALNSILDTWNAGPTYSDAVTALLNTTLRPDIDVLDDGDVDRLTGSAGIDWFTYNGENDIVTDLKTFETGTDLA